MMTLPEIEPLLETSFTNFPGLNCRCPNLSCQWERCVPDCVPSVYDRFEIDYSEYMDESD
jgi:hypothetical protein